MNPGSSDCKYKCPIDKKMPVLDQKLTKKESPLSAHSRLKFSCGHMLQGSCHEGYKSMFLNIDGSISLAGKRGGSVLPAGSVLGTFPLLPVCCFTRNTIYSANMTSGSHNTIQIELSDIELIT